MKVMLVSTFLTGGAGDAAYRLHRSLKRLGVASQMLVQERHVEDDTVIVAPKTGLVRLIRGLNRLPYVGNLDRLPLKLHPNRDKVLFSPQWILDCVSSKVTESYPDLINLHWVCSGFLRIETITGLRKPIVWTLHDMWPFTGGCHYSDGCDHYVESCGACPKLHSRRMWDLSRWVWQRKSKAWQGLNLTIVTPSSWLASCAKASSLFKDSRIEVIPYGIDIKRYRPINRSVARQLLNLPQDKQFILFAAWNLNDPRKGFHLLQSALQNLSKTGWGDKVELVVIGSPHLNNRPDLGIRTHYLGKLSDVVSMALVYSAANVFVAPSIQDNLPNTVMESIACGTPCVAFQIGGMPDLVEHRRNGYLAQPFQVEDLAQGIAWALKDEKRQRLLSTHARKKAEQQFSLKLYAGRYQALFSEILENHTRSVYSKKSRTISSESHATN